MAYSEKKDLIQNVKELRESVDLMTSEFSEIQPSMDEILELKSQFENLSTTTTKVIDDYRATLDKGSADMVELLENCKSQVQQVTTEVEQLVNLEVNFSDIKDKILKCLEIYEDVTGGGLILMPEGEYIEVADRKEGKFYLNVTDKMTSAGEGGTSSTVKVSPSMAISYDAPQHQIRIWI